MGHNRMSKTFPYAGRVYDGPCEADFIENYSPYYEAMFSTPLSSRKISDPIPSVGFELDRALYKWSRDIRAWVWVQPRRTR